LSDTVEDKPVNHIVEADIKGFFDNVNQEWLMKFLAHRIEDKRIQRMVKRFLKAGVAEDGNVTVSDEGTPQGGSFRRYWRTSIFTTPLIFGLRRSTARVAKASPVSSVMRTTS
jgi:retron-type reverse transcriptase